MLDADGNDVPVLIARGRGGRGQEGGEAPSAIAQSYRRLRQAILNGELAPGSKLLLDHLRHDYGVSAGTLREAVSLLLSDGLVSAQPQRGFRVVPISLSDFEDLTRVRILIECEALRRSIAQGDDGWEATVVGAFHLLRRAEERLARSPDDQVYKLREDTNHAFHQALIAADASQRLGSYAEVLNAQSERYRLLAVAFYRRQPELFSPRDAATEHRAIFEAAIARNADLAARALEHHIMATLDTVRALPAEFFTKR